MGEQEWLGKEVVIDINSLHKNFGSGLKFNTIEAEKDGEFTYLDIIDKHGNTITKDGESLKIAEIGNECYTLIGLDDEVLRLTREEFEIGVIK